MDLHYHNPIHLITYVSRCYLRKLTERGPVIWMLNSTPAPSDSDVQLYLGTTAFGLTVVKQFLVTVEYLKLIKNKYWIIGTAGLIIWNMWNRKSFWKQEQSSMTSVLTAFSSYFSLTFKRLQFFHQSVHIHLSFGSKKGKNPCLRQQCRYFKIE